MKRIFFFCFIYFNSIASYALNCFGNEVMVTGFAHSFIYGSKINDAKIAIENYDDLNLNMEVKTDKEGVFSFCTMPGYNLTFTVNRTSSNPLRNYISTQSATIMVPNTGLEGKELNVAFQTPRMSTYNLLTKIITTLRWVNLNDNSCQVATTIRAKGKTLEDGIQGVEDAVVTLNGIPAIGGDVIWPWSKPFYFNILLSKTWPFSSSKIKTSADGGVLIYNLPASDKPYQLSAIKDGMKFSSVNIICKPGAFINAAPPHSPTEL